MTGRMFAIIRINRAKVEFGLRLKKITLVKDLLRGNLLFHSSFIVMFMQIFVST